MFPKPIKGSLAHLTIGAVDPEIDYIEISGSRNLRKEHTEFFSTIPATEHVILKLKNGETLKMSERPDLLMKVFGYPEDFNIHPDLTFPEILRLIGNSVPPPLAKAVYTGILRQLLTLK
ncbi:MAG: DNA cytosine methyltransferase [Bacteroidetes bacterium]|nr:DNA cytosine methyltransferase [Bacteroidota bacterium]